jgi:hypothetical protein
LPEKLPKKRQKIKNKWVRKIKAFFGLIDIQVIKLFAKVILACVKEKS